MGPKSDKRTAGVSTEQRSADGLTPLDVVRAARGRMPYVMHRVGSETLVGLGVSLACGVRDSLRATRDLMARRLEEAVGKDGGAEDVPLFFQVAFEPSDGATGELWSDFERLQLVCPRLALVWRDGELTLIRCDTDESSGTEVEAILERARKIGEPEPRSRELRLEHPGMEAYRTGVRRVIASESADKVVIARRAAVVSNRPFDPSVVLSSLARRYPSARLFALAPAADGPVFLGASPERLIQVADGRAETMALAGTAERGDGVEPTAISRQLMQSAKDRDEHAYVTRMIAETLEGLGADVDVAAQPRPMVLPNVVHLETPISAELPEGVGVVDLVDALHPTPAVCGTPTDEARRMIGELEPFDRGLYAGALGWTNLRGEGDVTVALRCGLLRDRHAHLFAGGGITADSRVEDEERETKSKFMPVLEALREAVA